MTKIMIVDDEALVRQTLKCTIEWQKYDCEIIAEASDGFEAIEIYKQTLPDIIITDIVMTDSNGLDFISSVKEINPNVEFIILSGYDNFEYAQTALKYNVSSVSASRKMQVISSGAIFTVSPLLFWMVNSVQ